MEERAVGVRVGGQGIVAVQQQRGSRLRWQEVSHRLPASVRRLHERGGRVHHLPPLQVVRPRDRRWCVEPVRSLPFCLAFLCFGILRWTLFYFVRFFGFVFFKANWVFSFGFSFRFLARFFCSNFVVGLGSSLIIRLCVCVCVCVFFCGFSPILIRSDQVRFGLVLGSLSS